MHCTDQCLARKDFGADPCLVERLSTHREGFDKVKQKHKTNLEAVRDLEALYLHAITARYTHYTRFLALGFLSPLLKRLLTKTPLGNMTAFRDIHRYLFETTRVMFSRCPRRE